MKNILKLTVMTLMLQSAAFAQSVQFIPGEWNDINAHAKSNNKYVFVDCMTDWCSWCKVMDKETFRDATVAEYMNANFVSSQIDMEKGFGTTLAAKYHVSGFPTFLIFNPAGKLVYRSVGYQKPDEFMASLKTALDPATQMNFKGISDVMEPGFPDFYKNVFAEKASRKKPEPGAVDNFLDSQNDLFSEVSWSVMARFKTNEKHSQFFLSNLAKYRDLYGSEVDDKVTSIIYAKLNDAVTEKNNDKFKECFAMVDTYSKGSREEKESMKQSFLFKYYSGTEAWDKFATEFQNYLYKTNYKETATINSYCWDIYEKCNDAAVIAKSCEWMSQAIAIDPLYAYLDTYAAVLFKNKNYKEAKRVANKAIDTGKKNKEDVSSTEELLVKIKTALGEK